MQFQMFSRITLTYTYFYHHATASFMTAFFSFPFWWVLLLFTLLFIHYFPFLHQQLYIINTFYIKFPDLIHRKNFTIWMLWQRPQLVLFFAFVFLSSTAIFIKKIWTSWLSARNNYSSYSLPLYSATTRTFTLSSGCPVIVMAPT